MRIVQPSNLSITSQTDFSLTLQASGGEVMNITALAPDIIRVQHWPDGNPRLERTWAIEGDFDQPREGIRRTTLRSAFDQSYDRVFELAEANDHLQLTYYDFHIDIALDSPRLSWSNEAGVTFAADLSRRAYGYDANGRSVSHYMERREGEHYYGFGEKSGPLDKHGRRMRMVNVDAYGYNAETSDPLYKHIPFYITYVPELDIAYGLFYDNPASCVFDMGQEIDAFWGLYRYYQADDGDLDYAMIFGDSVAGVASAFMRLTGMPTLPPRWSLGYMGSTMAYTDAPDAQAQLAHYVELCQQHDIPCDLFHLSSGYSLSESGERRVFTWNHNRVPDPKQMVDTFHDAGIHVAANIKPYLLKTHPYYNEVAEQGGFIKESDGSAPATGTFWAGAAYSSGDGGYVDFTSAAGYDWWKSRATEALLDYGIDTLWNDNNEFQLWDDTARCDGFGEPIPLGLARPLQTLLMTRASYEAQLQKRPHERPFVLTRAATVGSQRYAQTWSGDNTTSWHTLKWNIPMGLGLGLSGMPNNGHDIGGFHGPAPEPELFIRWMQHGVFQPRFTTHSWNNDGTITSPWLYPEHLPLIRDIIRFRYRLIPYLNQLMHEAVWHGMPITRPMVYEFQQNPNCHTESFDFMLGRDLLVATVVEAGARTRNVYLPAGEMWCNWHTGEWFDGGQTVEAPAPLEYTPLFVRSNAIIPMGKPMRYVGAEPDDLRQLYAFPTLGTGISRITLIEDDGITPMPNRDTTALVVRLDGTQDKFMLTLAVQSGPYMLPYTDFEIVLPPNEARPVESKHIRDEWTDDDERRHIRVALPEQPK
jgi:alpha-glucosidase